MAFFFLDQNTKQKARRHEDIGYLYGLTIEAIVTCKEKTMRFVYQSEYFSVIIDLYIFYVAALYL